MSIRQLSVFAENKNGALYEITRVLEESGIDIRAFSVADTENYGVLRLIVNDPTKAAFCLSESGKIVTVTDVIGVRISDAPGGLSGVLKTTTENGISLEYLYAFAGRREGSAFVVLRVEDKAQAEKILSANGFTLLEESELH